MKAMLIFIIIAVLEVGYIGYLHAERDSLRERNRKAMLMLQNVIEERDECLKGD